MRLPNKIEAPCEWPKVNRNMQFKVRILVLFAAIFSSALVLAGCQDSHAKQAATVAQNGAQTAQKLADFYTEMANDIDAVPSTELMRTKIRGLDMDDAHYNEIKKQTDIQKADYEARANLANALVNVYNQYDNLAESKPDDVQAAVSNLINAATTLNNNHKFQISLGNTPVDNTLVTKHLNKLISYFYDLAKADRIKDANQSSMNAMTELLALVTAEEPVYESDISFISGVGHEFMLAKFDKNMLAPMDTDSLLGDTSPAATLVKPYNLPNNSSFDSEVTSALSDTSSRLIKIQIENVYEGLLDGADSRVKGIEMLLTEQVVRQQALAKQFDQSDTTQSSPQP